MSLKAIRDTIIIRIEYEKETKGGIVIPDGAKQYHGSFTGRVISVGPEYKYDVKVGDLVGFRRHEGHRLRYKGRDFLSLRSKWVECKKEN